MAANAEHRLLVGTRDGLYIFDSADRCTWNRRGPLLPGCDIGAVAQGQAGRLFVGTKAHGLFGSDDDGASWRELPLDSKQAELIAYYAAFECPFAPNTSTESSIWSIEISPRDPNDVYVGVLPAAIFRSRDGGESWRELDGFRRLPPTQELWGPFGAPFLHTIVLDSNGTQSVTVAVSVGGVFRSTDEGESWRVCTAGMDEWEMEGIRYPEVHRDVHKLIASPADPHRLYTTDHGPCIYRSDDAGERWVRYSLPDPEAVTRPIALHPRNPDHLWLVPLGGGPEEMPIVRERLTVLESTDGGQTFRDRGAGLPVGVCNVYRDGLAADRGDPAGLYLGTSRGELYRRFEDQDGWEPVFAELPPVRAIRPLA